MRLTSVMRMWRELGVRKGGHGGNTERATAATCWVSFRVVTGSPSGSALVDPDAVVLDDFFPAFRFGVHERGEVFRRCAQAHRQRALAQRAVRVQLFHGGDRVRVELR